MVGIWPTKIACQENENSEPFALSLVLTDFLNVKQCRYRTISSKLYCLASSDCFRFCTLDSIRKLQKKKSVSNGNKFATETFGQYSDAALQAPGLNNWVWSDAYRGYAPVSWAFCGGGTVSSGLYVSVINQVTLCYHYIQHRPVHHNTAHNVQ